MTRTTVTVRGRPRTISPDVRGGEADRLAAIVQARLLDELSGLPVGASPSVEGAAGTRGLHGHAGPGGLVALVGVPRRSVPRLANDFYEMALTVEAPGWLSRTVSGTLGPQAAFPDVFTALDLGDIDLHRRAMVLEGRVTRRVTVGTQTVIVGVPNARVRLTGIWRTLPPATATIPSAAPIIVALDPPLYEARPVPGGRLRRVTVTPVAGEDKRLEEDAPAGTRHVRLSDRVNLTPGSVVEIEDELFEMVSADGASDPAEPATIELAYALARRHSAGALARRATVTAPGTYRPLTDAAQEGDVSVLPDALTGLTAPSWVQVNAGGVPHEYHRLSRFDVLSDSDGRWRFEPLSRVAQLSLSVQEGGATVARTLVPTYDRGREAVDVLLP